MTISDETLSAFLDAELPTEEMEFIRQQLIVDESLANRLTELAMVDEQIANHYARIDARPMPSAITESLTYKPATIIPFPLWKRFQRGLQQHAAIAACTALVLGFGLAQLLPGKNYSTASDWSAIALALDNTASGTENSLSNGKRIKPRLTFINQEGNYCRQFAVMDTNAHAENIACRINGDWQLTMTVYSSEVQQSGAYQTATGGSLLDSALNTMMSGEAFDAQAESQVIKRRWNNGQ